MLFHTPEFLFLFLPVALVGFSVLGRRAMPWAFAWLAAASVFFYGWWSPRHVWLLLASAVGNYLGGRLLDALRDGRAATPVLAGLVAANLGLLGYFKYLTFFAGQVNALWPGSLEVGNIVLPVGISFYTFTQIAYLVDVRQGKARERNFVSYLLFVSYFPHLVAGPILHHAEMMPQFARRGALRVDWENVARGLSFFAMGLFKKIVLADGLAPTANEVFAGAAGGLHPADAWAGALAYSLQIYFDFSGYSDMAVGLSLLFNIKLPINFNSPYQATSIVDFWRRWHMTLSRFLRDYLYIPLGGNRRGRARRYLNMAVTMLLGGLWHGANWTFLIWGAVHGACLGVNHAWRDRTRDVPWLAEPGPALRGASWCLTALVVVAAWVFFRAGSLGEALALLRAMAGLTPGGGGEAAVGRETWLVLAGLWAWCALAPNTNRVMGYAFGTRGDVPPCGPPLAWTPGLARAVLAGGLLAASALVGAAARDRIEFLYFQF